eukprot:CAMPEP_0118947586 /NCGR_PEP_ID=MMETSP1169-20130426/46309_1 /TAXON_ID=36882 /ORGANISM="Pyramimonas obovata, Strain CCMP722" /LENGTH=189 /DNA_ID=CAMNT_0006893833 /DNA_START=268 /DNA_END=837 /DNA_ORIENTATION=-
MTLSWFFKRGMCGGQRKEPARSYDAQCVFCRVAAGEERPSGQDRNILFKDGRMVAFKDRSPAAEVHLLVSSIAHIESAVDLQRGEEDYKLAKDMLTLGQALISEAAPDAKTQFGFHIPPFNSVDHLHLHCFALPFKPAWKQWKYTTLSIPGINSYVSADEVLEKLRPAVEANTVCDVAANNSCTANADQ